MTKLFRTTIRKYAERWRVWAFLGCILLAGLGTGSTVTNLLNRASYEAQTAAYERQIERLTTLNRVTLQDLISKVDALTSMISITAQTAQTAATTAKSAASTANSAATTARGAAKNAAKAAADTQIRITEVKPAPGLKVKP